MPFQCEKCGVSFPKNQGLAKHMMRKTPCAPILDIEDLPEKERDNPNKCQYCGRVFTRAGSLKRHIRQSCKIALNEKNGNAGMEKLMEHTLQRQITEQNDKINQLTALVTQMAGQLQPVDESKQPQVTQNAERINNVTNNVDNSVTQNIQINVFGHENVDHITRGRVHQILAPLMAAAPADAAVQAILQTAILIYSDPERPENVTCFLPNKKTKDALVYGDAGWEIKPISLVLPPMMQKSVDLVFDKQPIVGVDDSPDDTDMDACGRILKEMQVFEKDVTRTRQVAGPDGMLRTVLVRNKDQLKRTQPKIPAPGTK